MNVSQHGVISQLLPRLISMSGTNDTDADELTVASLSKSKADIFSEHGLESTTLGKAREKKATKDEANAATLAGEGKQPRDRHRWHR